MQQIQYIKQQDIDKNKWNQCITNATNGLIYGYAWYLDSLFLQWDALVMDDYKAVMPITWKKKYGIYYLYQPWFCAALGIFSTDPVTSVLMEKFLDSIPKKFRYIDIYLNHHNFFLLQNYPLTERRNYILPLNDTYATITANYRTNLKRNIKKAANSGLLVKKDIPINEILLLAKNTMQRVSDITDTELNNFENVYMAARSHTKAETLGIFSTAGELLSSAAFLFSHKRWNYILVGNHPNGKTLGASHYLIDRFIHTHAGEDALLDFEGSDIRNLAFFYSSYGASEEKYPALRMNRLPAILKWLKKD